MKSSNWSVSLIIPTYNGQELLKRHLPQVITAAMGAEVVVVDDASVDGTAAWIKANWPSVKLVVLEKNVRFAAACNAGVKAASGEIVVFLNNDVSPNKNFLEPLLKPLTDPRVAAVGCLETDPNNQGKLSGRSGGQWQRGLVAHWRAREQADGETFWVSGGSGAFRKKIWDEVGGFDPIYTPAYQEDRDLSYRLWKRGYKVLVASASRVSHHHESTNPTALGIRAMAVASHRNSLIFVWKNITDKRLIGSHLGWLPYHLTVTNWRTQGDFGRGFYQALLVFAQVRQSRKQEKIAAKVNDRLILAKTATITA